VSSKRTACQRVSSRMSAGSDSAFGISKPSSNTGMMCRPCLSACTISRRNQSPSFWQRSNESSDRTRMKFGAASIFVSNASSKGPGLTSFTSTNTFRPRCACNEARIACAANLPPLCR